MPSGSRNTVGLLSVAAAKILRQRQGDLRLSDSEIGRRAGIKQTQARQFLIGLKPMMLHELEAMCAAVGVDVLDVTANARGLAARNHDAAQIILDSDMSAALKVENLNILLDQDPEARGDITRSGSDSDHPESVESPERRRGRRSS